MADLSSPFASSAEYGDTTLRPGQWPYQAAKHCECCAATPDAAPLGPRNTIGTGTYTRTFLLCTVMRITCQFTYTLPVTRVPDQLYALLPVHVHHMLLSVDKIVN